MRAVKAKALRRKAWTFAKSPLYDIKSDCYLALKRRYGKGVPLGLQVYYPRKGRNWRELLLYAAC